MQTPRSHPVAAWQAVLVTAALMLLAGAQAPAAEKVLYSFTGGADGGGPNGGLVFDATGNLLGTTHFGGIVSCGGHVGGGCGIVFELSRSGRKWTETPLYAFADGADGGFPNSGVLDAGGNLIGTASTGGSNACAIGCGVAYELVPSSGTWTEYVLHTFTGPDGQFPNASLLPVGPITLFSTTVSGGTGSGTVFELQSTPLDDGWQETVLYSFMGKNDGSGPYSGVAQDTKGNLYGTTYPSDAYNGGVAYELTLGNAGKWKEQVLHAFGSGKDGSNPYAGVIVDTKGNLFGTTINGGANGFGGIVYELSRTGPTTWTEAILHSFGGSGDGSQPYGGLIADSSRNLYGTTLFGGTYNSGTIFELTPKPGNVWKERVLYSFTGKADGQYPSPGLLLDSAGNLFGTTSNGGAHGAGVVFELVR
jgi:uncharacterized repeat protein (TIGR03803 family)